MIAPAVFAFVVVLLIGEALILWLTQLSRARADEEAYWRARDNRPPLYDWAEELDL